MKTSVKVRRTILMEKRLSLPLVKISGLAERQDRELSI